jgi:hypothetical protein
MVTGLNLPSSIGGIGVSSNLLKLYVCYFSLLFIL